MAKKKAAAKKTAVKAAAKAEPKASGSVPSHEMAHVTIPDKKAKADK